MAFERPTLAALVKRAIADIELRLTGSDARLRNSFENVIARVVAGAAHGLHAHLLFLSKQIFPDTAESNFLRRWASIFDVTPKDPAFAQGNLVITGVDTTSIPAGTEWQRADGVSFTTDAIAAISGSSATVAITATEAGADGNTDASTSFTIVTPITDIDSTATVDGSGLTGGADAEDDDALLSRLLIRLRTPPSGGGPNDYVAWALEVSGVTRAWEYPQELGVGTVSVRFVVDGEADIIPAAAKVTEVQTYIDALAPVTADVTVVAPVDTPLAMTISITPDTAAIRTAVEAELEALMLRSAEPGGTIYLSQINEAISLAEGETDHTLTVPAADVTHTTGQLATLGTITWV
jgi:uncharacterized phage protein gp47/JayE